MGRSVQSTNSFPCSKYTQGEMNAFTIQILAALYPRCQGFQNKNLAGATILYSRKEQHHC
jgi:hypothetical protein